MLFFALQSVASVVEVEAVNAHDQIHHQLEANHDETLHYEKGHENSEHEGHHAHLCHHHHGEHSAKVFIQAPSLYLSFIDDGSAFVVNRLYQNVDPKSLFRPPIS